MAPRSDLDQRPAHDPDAARRALADTLGVDLPAPTTEELERDRAESQAAIDYARRYYGHQVQRP